MCKKQVEFQCCQGEVNGEFCQLFFFFFFFFSCYSLQPMQAAPTGLFLSEKIYNEPYGTDNLKVETI